MLLLLLCDERFEIYVLQHCRTAEDVQIVRLRIPTLQRLGLVVVKHKTSGVKWGLH